jgi:hypothetical protein
VQDTPLSQASWPKVSVQNGVGYRVLINYVEVGNSVYNHLAILMLIIRCRLELFIGYHLLHQPF